MFLMSDKAKNVGKRQISPKQVKKKHSLHIEDGSNAMEEEEHVSPEQVKKKQRVEIEDVSFASSYNDLPLQMMEARISTGEELHMILSSLTMK